MKERKPTKASEWETRSAMSAHSFRRRDFPLAKGHMLLGARALYKIHTTKRSIHTVIWDWTNEDASFDPDSLLAHKIAEWAKTNVPELAAEGEGAIGRVVRAIASLHEPPSATSEVTATVSVISESQACAEINEASAKLVKAWRKFVKAWEGHPTLDREYLLAQECANSAGGQIPQDAVKALALLDASIMRLSAPLKTDENAGRPPDTKMSELVRVAQDLKEALRLNTSRAASLAVDGAKAVGFVDVSEDAAALIKRTRSAMGYQKRRSGNSVSEEGSAEKFWQY